MVTAPKTRKRRRFRTIPLFPELREALSESFELASEGDVYCISRRVSTTGLHDGLKAILRKAGIERWPRLFHQLRSSRQTELQDRFPAHVVCDWLGNSENVARQHYLQTTEEHFRKATRVVQGVVQQPSETACNGSQPGQQEAGFSSGNGVLPGNPTASMNYFT